MRLSLLSALRLVCTVQCWSMSFYESVPSAAFMEHVNARPRRWALGMQNCVVQSSCPRGPYEEVAGKR